MTRQYFFPSCVFMSEPGAQPFRIRYWARAGDGIRIVKNGVPTEAEFLTGKSLQIKVTAEKGPQAKNPFDQHCPVEYDPYIEFSFDGTCEFGKESYAGKEGLVVISDGAIEINDPGGNLPFTLNDLAEASHFSLLTPCGSTDDGPHFPR